MSASLYSREILRLAVSIPHQHRLENPNGTAICRSRTCGSVVTADVQLGTDGLIEDMGIEVNACALGQASAAILAARAIGKSKDEIERAHVQLSNFLAGAENSPGDWDDMDQLVSAREHPGRHVAIMLPYDAIISACQNARSTRRPSKKGLI